MTIDNDIAGKKRARGCDYPDFVKIPKNSLTELIKAISEKKLQRVVDIHRHDPILQYSSFAERVVNACLNYFDPSIYKWVESRTLNKIELFKKAVLMENHTVVLDLIRHYPDVIDGIHKEIEKGYGIYALILLRLGYAPISEGKSTFLHTAVVYGKEEIARKLINSDHPVNTSDEDGDTPLHLAVLGADHSILNLLLSNGADVQRVNNECETPFIYAVGNKMLNIMHVLLQWGGKKAVMSPFLTNSATHCAVSACFYEGLEFLKRYELLDLSHNEEGYTPIDLALYNDDLTEKFFSILWNEEISLIEPFSVLMEGDEGSTYMHQMVKRGFSGLVRSFLHKHRYSKPFLEHIRDRELGIKSQPRIEDRIWVKDAGGNTLFHTAAKVGNIEILQMLYAFDSAFIDVKNYEGKAALEMMDEDTFRGFAKWLRTQESSAESQQR